MKTASVSELKASLSEYLSKVKAGEEVLVTDSRIGPHWQRQDKSQLL